MDCIIWCIVPFICFNHFDWIQQGTMSPNSEGKVVCSSNSSTHNAQIWKFEFWFYVFLLEHLLFQWYNFSFLDSFSSVRIRIWTDTSSRSLCCAHKKELFRHTSSDRKQRTSLFFINIVAWRMWLFQARGSSCKQAPAPSFEVTLFVNVHPTKGSTLGWESPQQTFAHVVSRW